MFIVNFEQVQILAEYQLKYKREFITFISRPSSKITAGGKCGSKVS